MITIINEKSSQSANFAKALGGESGQMPESSNLHGQYNIVYAAGHLFEFKPLTEMVPEDEKDNYTDWDYNKLPFDWHKINWQKQLKPKGAGRGSRWYFNRIKASLDQSDIAIIAGDNDESGEGDLLAWEIIDAAHFNGKVYRCYHDDETKESILKAFKQLKEIDHNDPLLRKAKGREKFDYLTIQYPRILTRIAGEEHVLPPNSVPRTGRLKATMIQLVGNQEALHENFTPHTDYQPILVDEDGHKFIKKGEPFYKSSQEAEQYKSRIPQNSTSVLIGKKLVIQGPPKMLDLSTASARLEKKGFDPNEFSKTVEDMYQKHYLSYPRPNGSVITEEQLKALIPLVPDICKVCNIDEKLIDIHAFRKNRIGEDSHGANRPGSVVPKDLNELKEQFGMTGVMAYVIFAKSFLSGFAPDKKTDRYIYGDSETRSYLATCSKVVDSGWEKVLKLEDDKKQQDNESDTEIKPGQKLTPDIWDKKASRPSLATSVMLQNFLNRNNVGTNATRQSTYEDITKKGQNRLIESKRGKLQLTTLGKLSFLGMLNTHLANIKMTKRLSDYLVDVGKGKLKINQVLDFFDTMYKADKKTILNNRKFYKGLDKYQNYTHQTVTGLFKPTNSEVSFKNGYGEHTFTQEEINQLLDGQTIKFKYQDHTVEGKLADHEKYGFGFDGKRIYPKKPTYKGTYTATGESVEIGQEFAKHKLTEQDAERLFNGETISFKTKSSRGKSYTARVKLKKEKGYKDPTVKWRVAFADDFAKNKKKKK